jgi:hypothetical protein
MQSLTSYLELAWGNNTRFLSLCRSNRAYLDSWKRIIEASIAGNTTNEASGMNTFSTLQQSLESR